MTALGAVFTPPPWARWALDRLGAPALVAGGASLCDPTAGQGAFVLALAAALADAGVRDLSWTRRVTLIERHGPFLEAFARTWRDRWGFLFPETNLIEADVVTRPPDRRFDLVVGNPPWVTYPDLDTADQEKYRPWFSTLGLVGRPSQLLLGASRLDLAALVTGRVFESLVVPGGRAGFFLPLSLFHNDGAPGRWRRWSPDVVYDLTDCRPFPGVATRCGWAEFTPGSPFPEVVPYFTGRPDAWVRWDARADGPGEPWRTMPPGTKVSLPRWPLPPDQRPRQGINTGGLNQGFHVARPPKGVDPAFVHPFAPKTGGEVPDRWVLVPYDRTGRILEADEVKDAGLEDYWEPWKAGLAARRGILLGSQLAKGRWWALLGVGVYAFAPWKVLWAAYGRDRVDAVVRGPRDDGTVWQADQALQAYIPCQDEDDALRIAHFLNGPEVAAYLASLRSAHTRNWAQPGRFKALWHPRPTAGTPEETTGN